VLHVMLLTEFTISLPQLSENKQTLKMHLVQQQRKPTNTPVPVIHNKADTRHNTPQNKNETKPAPAVESTSSEVFSATDTLLSASVISDQTSTATLNNIAESIEDSVANLPEDYEKNEPKEIAYKYVETEFEVKRGVDASAAGITKTIFNIDANGHYSIVSTTQAKGLISLFFGDLTQKSEGSVTKNGLRPDFYSYQYGNDAKKSQTANFNWNDGTLHMHTYKGDSSVNLTAGTQDFLSFMYQFMYSPPLETMQITMTNGKRLRTYSYSFEGEETITTKLGELKTIHLLKSSGDEDKTEIWLATDYQYLPVKIRKTEKDGTVIEQVVANIRSEISN